MIPKAPKWLRILRIRYRILINRIRYKEPHSGLIVIPEQMPEGMPLSSKQYADLILKKEWNPGVRIMVVSWEEFKQFVHEVAIPQINARPKSLKQYARLCRLM